MSEIFDPEEEPDGDALAPHHFYVGVVLALFGFTSIRPYYPAMGVGFTSIGLLVALNDVIKHMTPYPTPLGQCGSERSTRLSSESKIAVDRPNSNPNYNQLSCRCDYNCEYYQVINQERIHYCSH